MLTVGAVSARPLLHEPPAGVVRASRRPDEFKQLLRVPTTKRVSFIVLTSSDEDFQAAQWGEDAEAARRTERNRTEARALDLWFAALA